MNGKAYLTFNCFKSTECAQCKRIPANGGGGGLVFSGLTTWERNMELTRHQLKISLGIQ